MTDKPEEPTGQQATNHGAFFNEFNKKGKVYYGIGFGFMIAALIYWAVKMFLFFTEFHHKGLLDLLLTPIIEFVVNPLLWASLIFFKISQRHRLSDTDNK
jgi:hypothetical protein